MSVYKVIEIIASSKKGWEDAAQQAVLKAHNSVDNIEKVWVQDHSASVAKNGKIKEYRVCCKITFKVGS